MSVIRRFLLWLFGRLGLIKPPSPLITLELDMSNARLNWTLPQPNARQRPLEHVRIEARVSDTLSFAEIATVDVPEQTLLLQDLAPGDWQFRGIVVDDAGEESPPTLASIVMPFDAPSALQTFEAVLE